MFNNLDGQRNLPRWFGPLFAVARRAVVGGLEVQLPDGRVFRAVGPEPGPVGRIEVHRPRAFWRITTQGTMGFAESYLDGDWSSPDLQDVLDAAILNNERVARGLRSHPMVKAYERARHFLRRNTKSQAVKNIEAHYDLSNDFYKLWLDDSMTYSSALFDGASGAGESLETAQARKYASVCDRMGLEPGQSVLEIGCGWGGFAEFAARERGADVTGLTLSSAQLRFAQERVAGAGLAERVRLLKRDYRDEQGTYDRIASIEMFEAVGEEYWPAYFNAVRDRLRPGGQACLQIITIRDDLFERYRRGVDFIQKYIFPGGLLPSEAALRAQVAKAGLEWTGRIGFADSYSQTLRRWRARFEDAWPEIEALSVRAAAAEEAPRRAFDERFRRMWRFYLTSCAACFMAGTTDVVQITLRRP